MAGISSFVCISKLLYLNIIDNPELFLVFPRPKINYLAAY